MLAQDGVEVGSWGTYYDRPFTVTLPCKVTHVNDEGKTVEETKELSDADEAIHGIQERIPALLREIADVCKKHGLALAGNDFEVTEYDETVMEGSEERHTRRRVLVKEFYGDA